MGKIVSLDYKWTLPTLTSAVKAAAAMKRPFGDMSAMLFFNWLVSTVPNSFPLFPCQTFISVAANSL